MELFSKDLENAIGIAITEARMKRHSFLTLEHLLFGLTHEPRACQVLEECGVDPQVLQGDVERTLSTQDALPGDGDYEPVQTLGLRRVLQNATLRAETQRQKATTGANILVSLFQERDSEAVRILREHGVSLEHLLTREVVPPPPEALPAVFAVPLPLLGAYRAIVKRPYTPTLRPGEFFLEENTPDALGAPSWRAVPAAAWPLSETALLNALYASPEFLFEAHRTSTG